MNFCSVSARLMPFTFRFPRNRKALPAVDFLAQVERKVAFLLCFVNVKASTVMLQFLILVAFFYLEAEQLGDFHAHALASSRT